MRIKTLAVAAIAAGLSFVTPALAQSPMAGQGPVATACQHDIKALCLGKEHGRGALRACLESNKAKVSEACAKALDSTGAGHKL
jgi:hypothetical protein